MKIQYRIAVTSIGCFPQVRFKGLLFWGKWKKIAKHQSGYGLYELPDLDYPKTEEECNDVIDGFDAWYNKVKNIAISYKYGES